MVTLDSDMIWPALLLVLVAVPLAIGVERAIAKWRLAAAAALFLAAAGAAYQAVQGVDPLLVQHFGPTVALVGRLMCIGLAIWAAYLGIGQVKTWMRRGDLPDE